MTRRTRLSFERLDDRIVPAFDPAVNYAAGGSPADVVTADFNTDSVLDVAVANTIRGTISVLLGNADGTFQAAITAPTGNHPSSLAVGDFNGDGNPDLVAADDNYNSFVDPADVTVLLANGDGTFGTPIRYEASNASGMRNGVRSVAVADFNGDGNLDIAAGSYDHQGSGADSGYIGVLLGTGAGTFVTVHGWSGMGSSLSALVAADFNADGKLDLASPVYGSVEVAFGDGNGMFDGFRYYDMISDGSSIVAADFNADGKVDLAAAGNSSVGVRLGNGNGSFATSQTFSTGSGVLSDLAAADFNDDSKLDLIASNSSTGAAIVLLGSGNGAFNLASGADVGSGPVGVAVGDFNGDGRADAVSADAMSGTVSVLLNDGDWGAPPRPSLRIGDVTILEGNTGTRTATLTVTLSATSAQTVTVAYATANGTATTGDYTATNGRVTFAPGETTKTISVLIIGDRLAEPNETFFVNLSSPTNSTIADGQGVGTVTDDEPRISIGDVTRAEGTKNQTALFTFTVTLSATYDQPVTMSFQTVSATAKSGEDYAAKTGTLTFAPGETTKTITIEVKGDNKREVNESFYLDLFGNSSNSLFIKNRGLGTIVNDD